VSQTIFGGSQGLSGTSTTYLAVGWVFASNTTETNVQLPVVAGTFSNFTVSIDASSGSGSHGWTFTLRVNHAGSTTSSPLTCQIVGNGSGTGQVNAQRCADTTHTVTVAEGDLIDVQASSNTGSSARMAWAAKFVPN
jgi:hypothetical protein